MPEGRSLGHGQLFLSGLLVLGLEVLNLLEGILMLAIQKKSTSRWKKVGREVVNK